MDATTANVTRLTDDEDDEIAPSWSYDGQSIMFGARRSGTWQLMRQSIADGTRTQLTTDGGYAGQPSPDGKSILFTRLELQGVWMMPVEGGNATLLDRRACRRDRELARNNKRHLLHRRHREPTGHPSRTVDGRQRRRRRMARQLLVARIRHHPGWSARTIYAHWDRRESNIMRMEPHR